MADERPPDDLREDDDPEEMDASDEVGDLDGVEPHRIEPAVVPSDEGDGQSADAIEARAAREETQ